MDNSKQATSSNPGGMTDLHIAAVLGQEDEVLSLLQAGANPNQLNHEGQPPLFNALECSMSEGAEVIPAKEKIFEALWQASTPDTRSIQDKAGHTVLHVMAHYGFDKLMQKVLHEQPSLASKFILSNRQYPIHTAILNNNIEAVRVLCELDPEAVARTTYKDESALHFAARYGSKAMMETCFEHYDGNIDATDSAGKTPLAWAIKKEHTEIADYLRSQGADDSAVDDRSDSKLFC